MEPNRKPELNALSYDRAPLYASLWMALFFALRREYQLARASR